MTTRHAPTTPINRTGYADTRRAEGSEGIHTDTVASGPSASENADGPGRWQRPGAISRHARVTEKIRHDSEVTAVSYQRTRTPSSRDTGTPIVRANYVELRARRTSTAVRTSLPGGSTAIRFQASDIYGYYSLPWAGGGRGAWLYRLYARDGDLLYVGISITLGSRLDHHRARKPWWGEVDHAIVMFVGHARSAFQLERSVIKAEMPRYNIQNKPGAHARVAA